MSQTTKLLNLLSDGLPHRTDEIVRVVYGADHLGCARIAPRVLDLKKKGYNILPAKKDKNKPSLSWYVLKLDHNETQPSQEENWSKEEASTPQENSLPESSRRSMESFQSVDTESRQEMLHLW